MIKRTFVWTPGSVAQVRDEFAGRPAPGVVIVPLEVGTALVSTEPKSLTDSIKVSEWARTKDIQPVLFMWNADALAIYPGLLGWDWGRREDVLELTMRPQRFGMLGAALIDLFDSIRVQKSSHAKYIRAARRIANALYADQDAVLAVVREWQVGGYDVLIELFERTRKTDLAKIAGLIQSGEFDRWGGVSDMPVVPLADLPDD
ncbi:hypothetical protein DMH04_54365 [Kibdelosporangium aridum]|uniref:Uncharacterized protein n=1 Tax=Kibdelosporangium aridum TaxID=2030 RepID=A0A428XY44_KIBAR|nr:hypothetical protein [Kibdelosporangium aridum]RSM60268.1 hypothetical protein DMH04_54365 [Kibdelosporangium aridum]